VTLVIHAKEMKRTTNTGRLALHALVNSSMHIRGDNLERLDLSPLLSPVFNSYVLYPSADAVEIETLRSDKPIQLIVSDGNWRQAAKINTRHPELKHLPRVKIGGRNPAQNHLRKEHFREGLSTLEAIALALAAIEGEPVGDSLMNLYQAKLRATLEGRGRVLRSRVDQLPS
jgi:DTW domain-containing protein YfiP